MEECAFTKWIPSNQFMHSGRKYDPKKMTLERFGFIGMEKGCFWGLIGVIWKQPLPVAGLKHNEEKESVFKFRDIEMGFPGKKVDGFKVL